MKWHFNYKDGTMPPLDQYCGLFQIIPCLPNGKLWKLYFDDKELGQYPSAKAAKVQAEAHCLTADEQARQAKAEKEKPAQQSPWRGKDS